MPSLRFMGFQAGMPLEMAAGNLAELSGTDLSCTRSTVDQRVSECRARLPDPITSNEVDVLISALDSLVTIVALSGRVSEVQLQAWTSSLVSAYGRVEPATQGSQKMLQWVRHRQMLRLTWREHADSTLASVSLIDGPLLDGWQRGRTPVK